MQLSAISYQRSAFERVLRGLLCSLVLALTAGVVQGILLLRAATEATRALPAAVSAELQETRVALVGELAATRADLMAQIGGARRDLLTRTDRRLGDTLARVDTALALVDARSAAAVGAIDGVRADLKPALANAAAVTADAKDSWDDLYWDVKASVESGAVTMHSVAVASEAVSDAAPKLEASAVNIAKSADGIAADAHTATTNFVKPKTFWQGFKSWLLVIGRVGAAFI